MDDLRFFQDLHGSSDHRWSSREGGGSCKGGALSALELANRVENFNYGNEAGLYWLYRLYTSKAGLTLKVKVTRLWSPSFGVDCM
jgi:hypothetical protein